MSRLSTRAVRSLSTLAELQSPFVGADRVLDSNKAFRAAERLGPPSRELAATWACAGAPDPEVFHPATAEQYAVALAYCSGCPLATLVDCRARGMAQGEWGVWGGVLLERGRAVEFRPAGRPPKDEVGVA